MDLHINDLKIEKGYEHVKLEDISFREIDQEFVICESDNTFNSSSVNELYYCYIRPYEGMFFRLIGRSDQNAMLMFIDEDITESAAIDKPYAELSSYTFSKILENGDLISNQQIVNLSFDFYEDQDLLDTRKITWIDSKRMKGNPDIVEMNIEGKPVLLSLRKVESEQLICECGNDQYVISKDGSVNKVDAL